MNFQWHRLLIVKVGISQRKSISSDENRQPTKPKFNWSEKNIWPDKYPKIRIDDILNGKQKSFTDFNCSNKINVEELYIIDKKKPFKLLLKWMLTRLRYISNLQPISCRQISLKI